MASNFTYDLLINLVGNLCGWVALGLATASAASHNWVLFGNEVAGLFQICIQDTGNCRPPDGPVVPAVIGVRAVLIIFLVFTAFATGCNLAALCLIKSQAFLRKLSLALYVAADAFAIIACVVYTVAYQNIATDVVFRTGFHMVWAAFAFTTVAMLLQALSFYHLRKLHFVAV